MKLRPIRTEAEYDAALAEIDKYFGHEPEPGTPAGDRFDMLVLLIADYERKRHPIDRLPPVEMIKGMMALKGYTQTDLARLIGSRARASKILARKRHLTLPMIWKLSREWQIPAERLVQPYDLARSSSRRRPSVASKRSPTPRRKAA